jgi:hypothetical protein
VKNASKTNVVMTMSDDGFLFMHPESADIDPSTPSFEVAIGAANGSWSPTDVSDVPKVCHCGHCAVDWRPMFVLDTGLVLEKALQVVTIINQASITNDAERMWALVFVAGESPLSNLDLGSGYQ